MPELAAYLRKEAGMAAGVAGMAAVRSAPSLITNMADRLYITPEMRAQERRNAQPLPIPLRSGQFPSLKDKKDYDTAAAATAGEAQQQWSRMPWYDKGLQALGVKRYDEAAMRSPWVQTIEANAGMFGGGAVPKAQGLANMNKVYQGMYGNTANSQWANVTGGNASPAILGRVVPGMTAAVAAAPDQTALAVHDKRMAAFKQYAPWLLGGLGVLALGYGAYNMSGRRGRAPQAVQRASWASDSNWGGQ